MGSPPGLQQLLSRGISEKLARARGERFTQSALALRAGITRAAVSAIEAGQQGVSIPTLCQLALALDIEPGSLLPSLDELQELFKAETKRPAGDIVDEFLHSRGLKP